MEESHNGKAKDNLGGAEVGPYWLSLSVRRQERQGASTGSDGRQEGVGRTRDTKAYVNELVEKRPHQQA